MKLREAIGSLHQEHPEDTLRTLYTPWGEKLDKTQIRQEYPRPQFMRPHFTCLNGEWDYCIVPLSDTSVIPGKRLPNAGRILVPFSPEAPLSGAGRSLGFDEYLWYQRVLPISQMEHAKRLQLGKRCLLHFDAVDQQAAVYLNGREIAAHTGGYLPFTVDITDHLSHHSCLLQIRVRDETDTVCHSRGKQTSKRGGMFYTAQSGIWQSVWYEWVPANYISSCRITPDYDNGQVMIELRSQQPFREVRCWPKEENAFYTADCIVRSVPDAQNAASSTCTTVTLRFSDGKFQSWSPQNPYLYHFAIQADDDLAESYFAMRSYTIEKNEQGILRFCLNHKPCFLHGVLDQGYWPDGLMTAPCDEAFIYDIELAKSHGFNMLRKHIKIEALRWYYHCDRLGMIVWQDMVSGGSSYHMPLVCYLPTLFPLMSRHTKDCHYHLFSRSDPDERLLWEQECMETIDHLYNVPSLAVWVPFNEGWGQFDAARIADAVKAKDPTRLVDHASGWFDQKGGDFRSVHNYFRPLKVKLDGTRAFVISEYGGYACHIPEHSSVDRIYGYQKYNSPQDATNAFRRLLKEQLFPLIEQGLSAAVYTQLSDVEEEVNGLVTYDRKIVKISPDP